MRQLGVLMTATQKRLLLALTAVTALATATLTTSSELLPGTNSSFAKGVADGKVVVSTTLTNGRQEAFRWVDGTMTSLGSLPGDHPNGRNQSRIADLSDLCFAEGMPVLRLDGDGNPVFFHALCSFTSLTDGNRFTLNGNLYLVQNASQPWSLEQYDTNLFRFELRSGDIWPNRGGLLRERR